MLEDPTPSVPPATKFAASFTCHVAPERDAVRIRPEGELDVATVPKLRAQIAEAIEAGFRHVILDLAMLEFMDSTGLRLLLEFDAKARADGFSLTLAPGPPVVQRVFEITRTEARLPFTDG